MDSLKGLDLEGLSGYPAGVLLLIVGVQYVTSKDIILQICAELPPGHQLQVDLVASLHRQCHSLRKETDSEHGPCGRRRI